ncbi:MAG: hypothetical protein ACTSYD_11405 [Candidatus Heimdallarchaeaceae archaeon]
MSNNKNSKYLLALPRDNVVLIRRESIVTLYAGFIIKPKNAYFEQNPKEQFSDALFLPLKRTNNYKLKMSLTRLLIPGSIKKKDKKSRTKNPKGKNARFGVSINEEKEQKEIGICFLLFKAWKQYDLSETLLTTDEMIADFTETLKEEAKDMLYNIGKVGRIIGKPLMSFIAENKLPEDFLVNMNKKNVALTEVGKNFGTVIARNKWAQFMKAGPATDVRPTFLYDYPTALKSGIELGASLNGQIIGLPENPSFPILVAGDKKTREIIIKKLVATTKNFVILDPRQNLEFEAHIPEAVEYLQLGANFVFNCLDPFQQADKTTFELYLANLIEIIKSVSDARYETIIWLKDIVHYYLHEYQDSTELLHEKKENSITLNELYAMITTEPGGLILSDFQLSAIRALLSELRDDCIANNSSIHWKDLLKKPVIIDFSHQSYKIQKLFLYSFLAFLSLYPEQEKEILLVIDDAELFFANAKDSPFFTYIFKELIGKNVKIILSTAFPSQLCRAIFDLIQNKIVGTLRSSKCIDLIAQQHGIYKQKDFLYRLPKNSFLLFREDLTDKPLLLRFTERDLESYLEEKLRYAPIKPKKAKKEDTFASKLLDPRTLINLHPIMHDILLKLALKMKRGINTESIVKLFPQWPEHKVKEAVILLEKFGYIYHETADKKGTGETWTRITVKGKQFLDELEETLLAKIDEDVENFAETKIDEEKEGTRKDIIADEKSVEIKEKSTEGSGTLATETDDITTIIQELLVLRGKIKILRDKKTDENKLIALYQMLKELDILPENVVKTELEELLAFRKSLQQLLEEKEDLSEITEEIEKGIFRKVLSLIDLAYTNLRYQIKQAQIKDQQFVEKLLEKEFETEKWQKFENPIPKTAEPRQIRGLLTSTYPEEVVKGLEFSMNMEDGEFIKNVQQAIASLIQIKMEFWPNVDPETYLEQIRKYFLTNGLLEPFEKSREKLWEYSVFADQNDDSVMKAQQRREILQTIKIENESFELDLKAEEKEELIGQLIEAIKVSRNDERAVA